MKNTIKRILIFTLIAGMLIFPGCTQEPEEKAPSNYAQLHGLLGRSITEVCQTLGIDEAQVDLALDGKANFPSLGEAQYAGLTWDTYPNFDKFDRSLCGFYYIIRYKENPDQAAPIFMDVLAALDRDYGEPKQSSDTVMFDRELTAENILNTIWSRNSCSADRLWYPNHEITPEIQAFEKRMLALLPAPSEGDNYATVGLDYIMSVQYHGGLDSAYIAMTYQFTARRTYIGPSREERLEAQSQNTNSTQQTP